MTLLLEIGNMLACYILDHVSWTLPLGSLDCRFAAETPKAMETDHFEPFELSQLWDSWPYWKSRALGREVPDSFPIWDCGFGVLQRFHSGNLGGGVLDHIKCQTPISRVKALCSYLRIVRTRTTLLKNSEFSFPNFTNQLDIMSIHSFFSPQTI